MGGMSCAEAVVVPLPESVWVGGEDMHVGTVLSVHVTRLDSAGGAAVNTGVLFQKTSNITRNGLDSTSKVVRWER